MNIVHLVVVETLSTFWDLEEPFTKFSSFQSYFGDQKNLVKFGLNSLKLNFYSETIVKTGEQQKSS